MRFEFIIIYNTNNIIIWSLKKCRKIYSMFPSGASCKCGPGYYLCANNAKCIPSHKICDGFDDCPGDDDEDSCRKYRVFVFKYVFQNISYFYTPTAFPTINFFCTQWCYLPDKGSFFAIPLYHVTTFVIDLET